MNTLSSWAIGVSVCAVLSCLVELTVINTRLEKVIRFVVGAFMICAMILPLGGIKNDLLQLEFNSVLNTELPENLSAQQKELLQSEIAKLVRKTLKDGGITPSKTEIDMDINDENCISMITAKVELERADLYKARQVKEMIAQKLSIDCQTTVKS